MNKLYIKKMPKFEQDDQKILGGYSSILDFFLIKHILILCFNQFILY